MSYSKSKVILLFVTAVFISLSYYVWRKPPSFSKHLKCHKAQLVAFIKSHRVGGTSVQNVIQRFGETNKLLAAVPRTHTTLDNRFHNLAKIPNNLQYSIFYSHTKFFNRTMLDKTLPAGTLYFTIVREPFSQLTSAFYNHKYKWRTGYLSSIPDNPNPLREYLKAPDKYDPAHIQDCFTNNRMSYDLGLSNQHFNNTNAIKKWLGKLDDDLDIIVLMEQFDQSMVLLKRKLCWEIKDVLYVTKNSRLRKVQQIDVTSEDINLYKKRYIADIMLYNYSVRRFKKSIAEQTPDFQDEVVVFKKIIKKSTRYCQAAFTPDILLLTNLTIAQTKFSAAFQVTPWDCESMMLSEVHFLRRTRTKQNDLMFVQDLMLTEKPRYKETV